jgi:hypothetical protein
MQNHSKRGTQKSIESETEELSYHVQKIEFQKF